MTDLFKNADETLAIESLLEDYEQGVAVVRFVYDAMEETDWGDEAGIGVALHDRHGLGTELFIRVTDGDFKDTDLLDLFKAWVDRKAKERK